MNKLYMREHENYLISTKPTKGNAIKEKEQDLEKNSKT